MEHIYELVTFHTGLQTIDKACMVKGYPQGETIQFPIWSEAILGSPLKILIDTGIHDPQWVNDNSGEFYQQPDESFCEALMLATGWKPDEVDVVIHTHLHYDHIGNDRLCKNAVFYVQREEYDYAQSAGEDEHWLYVPELLGENAVKKEKWRLLDGDSEILPGIRVIRTPGHSVGHQSVLIETAEGILCVAGDVVNMRENLWENKANGLCTDEQQCLDSMERVRQSAQWVMPGHEPLIHKYQRREFLPIKNEEGGRTKCETER